MNSKESANRFWCADRSSFLIAKLISPELMEIEVKNEKLKKQNDFRWHFYR